jgi:hypothetical protein
MVCERPAATYLDHQIEPSQRAHRRRPCWHNYHRAVVEAQYLCRAASNPRASRRKPRNSVRHYEPARAIRIHAAVPKG